MELLTDIFSQDRHQAFLEEWMGFLYLPLGERVSALSFCEQLETVLLLRVKRGVETPRERDELDLEP